VKGNDDSYRSSNKLDPFLQGSSMKRVNHQTILGTLLIASWAMHGSLFAEETTSLPTKKKISISPAATLMEQTVPRTIGAVSPANAVGGSPFCVYPMHAKRRVPEALTTTVLNLNEIESNNTIGTAQVLPLGPAFGQSLSIDVSANLSSNSDNDFYSFVATKGDVIGVATQGGPVPNMTLSLFTSGDTEIIRNNNHNNQGYAFPPNSPLPGGVDDTDAALSWIAPASDTYFIRARCEAPASAGSYSLYVRASRPGVALQPSPDLQIVWLDFDGATINAQTIFGTGNSIAELDPLSHYLEYWGLDANDEDAVIDAILATVQENYDDLRLASLNGNRPTDNTPGHMHIAFRNSRDHGDLWGQPNVARIIIGGSQFALGIDTLGIAQYIDVGNFSTEDTAVVLLDIFSAPDIYESSINAVELGPGADIIDAIGRVVGYTVSHELGHLLGNWHTDNDNTLLNVMDKGGGADSPDRRAGVGPDGILGTADDIDVDFVTDEFDSQENISIGLERTTYRTAFGLSTGAGTLYVDRSHMGTELGSYSLPYNTVTEAHNIITPGGNVIIKAGNYPEALWLTTPARFDAEDGTARIGP
jgi:hypothetical protein